jgi:hypothetical protein
MKRKPTAPTHQDLVQQADRERPNITWRERQAIRRLQLGGRFERSDRCGFDPMELRLGLQAQLRQNRPYYAINNPIYHDLLLRHPRHDDSLPGPAWLQTVYHGNRRDLVTLPGVRVVLRARAKAIADQYRMPEPSPARKAPSPQADLFTVEDA